MNEWINVNFKLLTRVGGVGSPVQTWSGTLFWTFLGVFTEWPKKILFWMLVEVFVTLQTPTDM